MSFFFIFIFYTIGLAHSVEWGVQIIDNKKSVKRFNPNNELLQIPVKDSLWKCFLSKTLETRDGFARSIDCKYGKTKGLISVKLYCEKKRSSSLSTMKKNATFALAEDEGAGYLFELVCQTKLK